VKPIPPGGVLLLDKPTGPSSNEALQVVRRLLGAGRAGHGGTLDPLASGLLLVLLEEATRFARFVLETDKEYVAEAVLGARTSTGDAEGEVIEQGPVPPEGAAIEPALASLRGAIEQVPPMHSALKRGGRPLYTLARRGETVERVPRTVTVHALELIERRGERLRLRVRCAKGTYVRTLVEQLGTRLGTAAHLASLRRTAIGAFRVEEAIGLEALRALAPAERQSWVRPVDLLLSHIREAHLSPGQTERFLRGQSVVVPEAELEGWVAVRDSQGRLLGVGRAVAGDRLRPVRLRDPRALQLADLTGKTL